MPQILRVTEARVCGPFQIQLTFNDGTEGVSDLSDVLEGPMLEALRDESLFSQVELDPICGTIVWPNGADLAPEALMACLVLVAV